jgi:hypothetical protein
VVWGRRRVGKTFLLTHFAADKRSVYFTATRQDTDERQLRRFAEALREQLGTEVADLAPETCRWQARPLTRRDLGDLERRAAHLPPPGETGLTYAFWSRGAGRRARRPSRRPDVHSGGHSRRDRFLDRFARLRGGYRDLHG